MLMTSQLKVGAAFMYEGNPLIVQKMLGQRSGRAGMVTNLRVKNLVTGSTMDLGIDAGEKFDEVDLDTVSVGCSVRLYDADMEEEVEYRIVGSTEADSLNFKISNESPVGSALIGRKVGETVEVETQVGELVFRILEIQRANI